MKIKVCETNELDEDDWADLITQFNLTFDRENTIQDLINHYSGSVFGFSYHAIARNENGEFCGHTSVMPQNYLVNGKTIKMGLSGGTFVVKKYRSDIFIFKKMYEALKERCSSEKLIGIVGVPNENSFKYTIKILKKKHLKNLDYYILPVSIFHNLRILTTINYWIIRTYTFLHKILSNLINFREKKKSVEIEKSEEFLAARLGPRYCKFSYHTLEGSYRIFTEKQRNVAYIMHFQENGIRSYRSLAHLVHHIVKNNRPDIIIFAGTLNNLLQPVLFRLPSRFHPKTLPLTITLLSKVPEDFKQTLLSPDKWDFGLINFDVR